MLTLLFIFAALLCSKSNAQDLYYVFGAAEDDCQILRGNLNKKVRIIGEACTCIKKSKKSSIPNWRINWSTPSCYFDAGPPQSSNYRDCRSIACTQKECLTELYDTQHSSAHILVDLFICKNNHLEVSDYDLFP